MAFGVQTEWHRDTLPKPEILSYPLTTSVIDSGVINASGVTPDLSGPYKGRRYLLAGTVISKRGDGQYERYTAGAGGAGGTNEVQTITLTNASTGETWTYATAAGAETTSPLAYNASAADVRAAINALGNVQDNSVSVTGAAGGPYTLTWATGVNEPQGVVVGTGDLTGAVVQTTQGAQQNVAGILYETIEFADGSDKSDQPTAFLRRGVSFDKAKIIDYVAYKTAIDSALSTCEFV